MVPPVHLQNLLVIPRKAARLLSLPEDPRTRPDEVVVKQPLMEGPLPPLTIQRFQGLPALLDALKAGPCLRLCCAVEVRLEGVARDAPSLCPDGFLRLNVIVGGKERGVVYAIRLHGKFKLCFKADLKIVEHMI